MPDLITFRFHYSDDWHERKHRSQRVFGGSMVAVSTKKVGEKATEV
jgi:hypothetical protein